MTELSGTLDGVGLPAIVRFLGGLKKSGSLRLLQHEWRAEIFFDAGEVVEASFGSRSGIAALDAAIETLPHASFEFDTQARPSGEPSIRLSREALQMHLNELTARAARGERSLPLPDAVPQQIVDGSFNDDEPLPLDRGTLQTLVSVDGRRTVREIVTQRETFEALWQLGYLIEVGVIGLPAASAMETSSAPPPAAAPEPPAPIAAARLPAPEAEADPPVSPYAVTLPPVALPAPTPIAAPPSPVAGPTAPTSIAAPTPITGPLPEPEPEPQVAASSLHCPKLGFEDDPSQSFGRPTRLHRCFAASAPLPLSLDQQRELCLSDQFGMCPRLATASQAAQPAAASPSPAPRLRPPVRKATPASEPAETDDPRIVRLPLAARAAAVARQITDSSSGEPTRLRAAASAATREQPSERVKPIRARLDQTADTASARSAAYSTARASVESPQRPTAAAVQAPPRKPRDQEDPIGPQVIDKPLTDQPRERRIFNRITVGAIAAIALVLVVGAVVAYLLIPDLAPNFADDSVDPALLPNTSRVAAGTPVSAIAVPRATPGAAAKPQSPANQPGQPTVAAAPTQSVVQPTAVITPAAQPTTSSFAASSSVLLDERFANNDAGWPNDPRGVASIASGSYRIATKQAGQFVAISAPIVDLPGDVLVSATFRKLAGPPGGGYGIIVRDQSPTTRDGTSQDGRYVVLEIGDKGEVGIWRREADHWVDLLGWQHSDAVKPGNATNELTVRAVGNTLSMSVNGTPVATRSDATLIAGGAGLFVGGDGNQVSMDHFTIQTP